MLARLFILAVCLPALALFCAGCAGGPDRWTATVKTNQDARTGRWHPDELDLALSGPIPPFSHE